jgi:hypothetical protein
MLGSCIVDNSGTAKRFQFPTSYYLYIDVRFDMLKNFLVQKFEKFLLICLRIILHWLCLLIFSVFSFLLYLKTPFLSLTYVPASKLQKTSTLPLPQTLEDRKRGVEMPWHPKMTIICALGCQNWPQHTIFTAQCGSKLFDGVW